MPTLMPRCTECVLCGGPIQGKGRIDRIYCSASCRTLAWRARSGDRWAGRRKSRSPQPGSYVARSALPLLAVRMKAELDAAKQRIAELERQASGSAGVAAVGAVAAAAAGAVAMTTAAQHRSRTRRATELERVRAEVQAEQERHRVELEVVHKQAAAREAALEKQVAVLTQRCEQAERQIEQTVVTLNGLTRQTETLRSQLAEKAEQQRQALWELGLERGKLMQAQLALQRYGAAWKAQGAQLVSLQEQLAAAQWQLEHEQQAGHEMRARLTAGPWQTIHRLDEDNQQLRGLLTDSEARAARAESAVLRLKADAAQQERRLEKHVEKIQLKLEARHQRQLAQVVEELKQLPVSSTTWERIVSAVSGLAVGTIAAAVGAKTLAGRSGRKALPPKEEASYIEIVPLPQRKRLPPKRG